MSRGKKDCSQYWIKSHNFYNLILLQGCLNVKHYKSANIVNGGSNVSSVRSISSVNSVRSVNSVESVKSLSSLQRGATSMIEPNEKQTSCDHCLDQVSSVNCLRSVICVSSVYSVRSINSVPSESSVKSAMRSKQVVIIARIRCRTNHCWQVLISISLHDRNQRKPQSLSGKTFFTSFPGVNVFSDISLMGTRIQKENILTVLGSKWWKNSFCPLSCESE